LRVTSRGLGDVYKRQAVGFIVALFLRETPLRTNADYASARNEAAGEALG
jgi:hypothetical protein